MKNEIIKPSGLVKSADRRLFLKRGSLSVAAERLLMIGCNDDEQIPMNPACFPIPCLIQCNSWVWVLDVTSGWRWHLFFIPNRCGRD